MLAERFAQAIRAAFPELDGPIDPMISPSRQESLGDFQCNAAMPLAKRLGKPPREIAAAIVAAVRLDDLAEPLSPVSIAGPGFINVRLQPEALAGLLASLDSPDLGVVPAEPRQTIVVDLCGVNLAKEMHVGHLRATVIGDAIARAFERLGHVVIRQNHVGDWGLPIAMVAQAMARESAAGRLDLSAITLDRLTRLYRRAQMECAADRAGLAAARRFGMGPKALAELEEQVAGADEAMTRAKIMLLKMQAHDPEALAVWKRIYDVTMAACLHTCERLGAKITDADSAGESSYADELAPMIEDLVRWGIAEESDGALVMRLDEFGIDVPVMIRKRDGGYLYATTDIAAVRRRVRKFGADRVIYAVGAPQILHLKQVFAAAIKAGYASKPGASAPSSLEHAAFGSILGDDGRPFRTRSGENVKLADLLDEAVARARTIVAEKSKELDERERAGIAEAVAIAAIKYADLSSDRIKDYVFSFDRMLAFEGNTGPYLLYAYVRVKSIFRKAQERGLLGSGHGRAADIGEHDGVRDAEFHIAEPAEKALSLTLLRYPATLASVAATLEPHRLCALMYDVAVAYAVFFDQCPVLKAEEPLRSSRLRLCALSARVLEDGLGVLGIPIVERM